MNIEQAKAFLPIITAFANGEIIEFRQGVRFFDRCEVLEIDQ